MFKGGIRKQIPLYTRAGWITAWIFIVVIITLSLRMCVGALDCSRKTEPEEIQHYFTLGAVDGRQGRQAALPEAAMENPLLRNAYNKGFRQGRDAATAVIDSKQ